MSSLPASAATAVALFAATNVDDLVVLALLSAASRASGRPRRWEIWAGQYLGFAVLAGLSLAAGRGLSMVPARYLWLLALIPLTVGLITLLAAVKSARAARAARAARHPGQSPGQPAPGQPHQSGPPQMPRPSQLPQPHQTSRSSGLAGLPGAAGVLFGARGVSWMAGAAGVATLTVVDGADNLAAYTPVFATAAAGRITVTLAVFAVGVAVWCAAGALLTRHHRITDTLTRYGRWILPVAFILIALYTLHASNAPLRL